MKGWMLDTLIGLVLADSMSVVVSVLLGFLYSKYHWNQRLKKVKEDLTRTFSKQRKN